MFRIGEFSRMSGVSAKMLRHYDSIGLFQPAWVDPSNDYRYYSAGQLAQLNRIVALKALGVPLAEVAALIAGGADLRVTLEAQRRELLLRRDEVDRTLARLDISIELAGATSPDPDVVVRRQPAELIAGLERPLRPGEDLGGPFYELEEAVRDAGVRAPRPPLTVNHPPPGHAEVAVPITARFDAAPPIRVRTLPKARVVSLIQTGGYEGLAAAAESLQQWIVGSGYREAGPLRVVYLRFSAEEELGVPDRFLTNRRGEFVTELQQPVAG
jgi:DNA-binding transcriptional MerR regulator